MEEVKNKLKTRHYKYDIFLNKPAMPYVMPPQPTPKQQKCRKHLIRRLKKRGMFIKDAKHKGAGTYGLLAPHGKMYIGKSVRYRGRMQDHKKHGGQKKDGDWKENKLLYKAIRKWGWDRFELFLFEKHDKTRADIDDVLNKQEIALIAEFETFTDRSKGYNLTAGGDGCSGRKATPEQRAYLRQVHNTPETKEAHSAASKEMANRPEVKAAKSAANKKIWASTKGKARKKAQAKRQNKPVVSKMLISGKNPIKTYQLIYHTSQKIAAEDLRLLFGNNVSKGNISSVLIGNLKHTGGFQSERFTNAPGQPTPERPIKRMRVTNI